MRTKVTTDVLAEIIDSYRKGMTIKRIAIKLGLHYITVGKHLALSGIQVRIGRPLTTLDVDSIVREYESGLSAQEIGFRHNVSCDTILKRLRTLGITIREAFTYWKEPFNEHAFDELTPDSKYWIGFLMADGSVTFKSGYPQIRLRLAARDKDHIIKFRNFLGSHKKLNESSWTSPVSQQRFHSNELDIRSHIIADRLAEFGVVPGKSGRECSIGLQHDRDFWRGAFDGDGWITKCGGCLSIGFCGSQALVTQFADFIERLHGFRPSTGKNKNANCWWLSLYSTKARIVLCALYHECSTYLDRKFSLAMLAKQFGA